MSNLPCGHKEPTTPPGCPYQEGQCRACWLFQHDQAYNLLWGGDGHVIALDKTAAPLPPPAPLSLDQGPGWFRKLVNFSKAAVRHAWHGLPKTPTPEQERRLTICLSCELLNPENGTCKHPWCGCSLLHKTAWEDQHCPIGKW